MESIQSDLSEKILALIKHILASSFQELKFPQHKDALYQLILEHINSQKSSYMSTIQIEDNDRDYIVSSIAIQQNSVFPSTIILLKSDPPLNGNADNYRINVEHELTEIIVIYCLKKLIISSELQMNDEKERNFEEILNWTDFNRFYISFLQILEEFIDKVNHNYLKKILLICLEKLERTNYNDLKERTIKILAMLLSPFPVDLYIDFKKILVNYQKSEIDCKECPYRTLCSDIIHGYININSNFEFNSDLFELSVNYIFNLFGYIVFNELIEIDYDYDDEDMILFCVSFYLIFIYFLENYDYLYEENFNETFYTKFNDNIILDSKTYNLQDDLEKAKSYIIGNYL